MNNRTDWDIGEGEHVFRLSKDRCQKFLEALVLTRGQIHDTFSLDMNSMDVFKGGQGEWRYNQKPHQVAVHFRISLPAGQEARFDEIMGEGWRTEPPRVQVGRPRNERNRPSRPPADTDGAPIRRTYDLAPPLGIPPNIREGGKWLARDGEEVRRFLDGERADLDAKRGSDEMANQG